MTSRVRYWASTAAIASVSALAVTIAGLVGYRAGLAETEPLVLELTSQRSAIDALSADLDRVRAERDRLAAELRDKAPQANRPKRTSHDLGL